LMKLATILATRATGSHLICWTFSHRFVGTFTDFTGAVSREKLSATLICRSFDLSENAAALRSRRLRRANASRVSRGQPVECR
jgi:hypothetical protein